MIGGQRFVRFSNTVKISKDWGASSSDVCSRGGCRTLSKLGTSVFHCFQLFQPSITVAIRLDL